MTVPREMNAGVELLLKRMETNPEEFTEQTKWGTLLNSHRHYLDAEDVKALDAGLNKIMQQRFTEKVLEGLVDPKPLNDGVSLKNMLHPSVTLSATQTPSQSSATLSNIANVISRQSVEEMLVDIRKTQQEQRTRQKTIFGKLKNYLHDDK